MILLLGASGYVGEAFVAELNRRKIAFMPLSRREVDYSRFDVLLKFLRERKPGADDVWCDAALGIDAARRWHDPQAGVAFRMRFNFRPNRERDIFEDHVIVELFAGDDKKPRLVTSNSEYRLGSRGSLYPSTFTSPPAGLASTMSWPASAKATYACVSSEAQNPTG